MKRSRVNDDHSANATTSTSTLSATNSIASNSHVPSSKRPFIAPEKSSMRHVIVEVDQPPVSMEEFDRISNNRSQPVNRDASDVCVMRRLFIYFFIQVLIRNIQSNWYSFKNRETYLSRLYQLVGKQTVRVQVSSNAEFVGRVSKKVEMSLPMEEILLRQQDPHRHKHSVYLCQCPIFVADDSATTTTTTTSSSSSTSSSNSSSAPLAALEHDFIIPPFLPKSLQSINCWLSFGRTDPNVHYDTQDNLLCVFRGEKRVTLLSPRHTRLVEPCSVLSMDANHSELERFPARSSASLTPLLRAGESLFIPEGWWHQVESGPDITMAFNFWFSAPSAQMMQLCEQRDSIEYIGRLVVQQMVERRKQQFFQDRFGDDHHHDDDSDTTRSLLEMLTSEDDTLPERQQHALNRFLWREPFDSVSNLLQQAANVVVHATDKSANDCEHWRRLLCERWSTETVEIITSRLEAEEERGNDDVLERLYYSIFDYPFNGDRSVVSDVWIEKRRKFQQQHIWKLLLSQVLGID
jgi:hypothetical protein